MDHAKKIQIWAYLMRLGNRFGCHQIEERSFHIKGMQFPVCSRCTGILTGQIVGVVLCLAQIVLPVYIDILFLLIMFLDWWIQYKKIKTSNNIRRFITGNLAGIAQVGITVQVIMMILLFLENHF